MNLLLKFGSKKRFNDREIQLNFLNNILFSLAAPFTLILNIFYLNQTMNSKEIIGCIIVFVGVVIAITYGDNKKNKHRWEIIEGSIKIGILMGILAALCQAIGLIMMKPILNQGADPIASAALRTLIATFLLSFTFLYPNCTLNSFIFIMLLIFK